ncbi:MAG: hypothetical protein GEV08_02080, partial [Acidimicrobiia bacterium]|nr:hypothetical protein [Acidimicrobiia bacterium]
MPRGSASSALSSTWPRRSWRSACRCGPTSHPSRRASSSSASAHVEAENAGEPGYDGVRTRGEHTVLSDVRVLDLTDERGQFAGAILARLGADVIAVEPPGGTSSRRLRPFAGGRPDIERSLWHWAYNGGKKSVVVDSSTDAGRAAVARLAADADIVLDSGALAVDLAVLRRSCPHLVTVIIHGLGAGGPHADWHTTDLTVWAASGAMHTTGDADRAPVRPSAPQSWLNASADAAGAALVALAEREVSGLGQHVDIAAQVSSMQATQSAVLAHAVGATPNRRMGAKTDYGAMSFRVLWPAKDGWVCAGIQFGVSLGAFTHRLMSWMCEEGFCDEATRDKDWVTYGMALEDGTEPVAEYERVQACLERFTASKTKGELLEGALYRKLLMAPVFTVGEVLENPHLAARGFWDELEVDGRRVRTPGALFRSDRPLPAPLGRAPRLGEHQDLLTTLSQERRATGAPAAPTEPGPARALGGLKVLDLGWAVAGPWSTRVLADHGATVVKIDSSRVIDAARTVGPFVADQPGVDNSVIYNNGAAGKLSLGLDITNPVGRQVLLDLVSWADVLTENFTPGVMARHGLSDAELHELNPGLIVVHSSMMGQSGPMSIFAGVGTMGAAIAGFYNLTGWADRPPAPLNAYTDYITPRIALAGLLAALHQRRRTGQSRAIDVCHAEVACHFLAPALWNCALNGVEPSRMGNDDDNVSPHGVYPTRGEDQWVALACED